MLTDDYANSMFRFEHLNEGWIDRCAAYIRHIFGHSIVDASVIDYAFGRGNWSMAFIRAGARKVYAVDASESNVARFKSYLKNNNINGIEVILGNVLEARLDFEVDILWIYGIYHHIDESKFFLQSLLNMCKSSQVKAGLLYSYDKNSLREKIVSAVRNCLVFSSYESFRKKSLLFSHNARLRARDDLTAPFIAWKSYDELAEDLLSIGCNSFSKVISFGLFNDNETTEFRPHHVRIGSLSHNQAEVRAAAPDIDVSIIGKIIEIVTPQMSESERVDFSVGLFNTHFDALAAGGYARALIEDYQFLYYAFKLTGAKSDFRMLDDLLDLSEISLRGNCMNSLDPIYADSIIFNHVANKLIRI